MHTVNNTVLVTGKMGLATRLAAGHRLVYMLPMLCLYHFLLVQCGQFASTPFGLLPVTLKVHLMFSLLLLCIFFSCAAG